MKAADIVIRPLREIQEMKVAVDLQRRIWGYSDIDTVPYQAFVVATETGGQVFAAFDDDEAIGFALAFAAFRHGTTYLHSHMVGVIPACQGRGVGRLLKLAQRDEASARGIDLIEWTFDPLQPRNAHFNLTQLGAIVRRYIPDFYGRSTSPLHGSVPTDRLVAEWWIQSIRVADLLNGKVQLPGPENVKIGIPMRIREICSRDPEKAEKIQLQLRNEFQKSFAMGLAVVGFELTQQLGSYVLEIHEDRIHNAP